MSDVIVGTNSLDLKSSPAQINLRLTDAEANPADVSIAYELPGGGAQISMELLGNPNLADLPSSPGGVVHTFHWDFASQLATGASYLVGLEVIVTITSGSSQARSPPFAVGNDPPSVLAAQVPSGEGEGVVPVEFVVADSSSDPTTIEFEFDNLDDAAGWSPATGLGPPLSDQSTSPTGIPYSFLWNTDADAPGQEFRARLRLVPTDGTDLGQPVETGICLVDNNQTPAALLNGSAFFASSDGRRGIPLQVKVVDPESDDVRLVFQWRRPGESFPSLPASASALEPILADPTQRLQHHVASEFRTFFEGEIVPVDSTRVRLQELSTSDAGLQYVGIPGLEVELVRPASLLGSPVSDWPTNPLSMPIAALSCGFGESALILDTPSVGAWRLRMIDLATGSVLSNLVNSTAGNATALSDCRESTEVLVAHESAGTWAIDAVDRDTGTLVRLITASGATALGPIRGLVSTSPDTAAITVGTSLISLDWADPQAPMETTLAADFQTPWGLAADPVRSKHVYVAERDWVDPSTSQPDGRIVDFDLGTRVRRQVQSSVVPLRRPQSIAVEAGGRRLLAVTDHNPLDGTRELRGVELNGAQGGVGFELGLGFPDGTTAIACGELGTRLLLLAPLDDLLVGGGVEQKRTIGQFDTATAEVTLALPFLPVPSTSRRWRISPQTEFVASSPLGRDRTFVWDSSDIPGGGDVVLRAVPYDAEVGLMSDTGVPRHLRSGIDVAPTFIGGPGITDGSASIALADLDGDGWIDLASANRDGDSVSVHLATATGVLPTTPDQSVQGNILAPMAEPAAIHEFDADSDGDLDLATANRGSNNVSLILQVTPGTFTLHPLALTGSLTAPSDVASGLLNGDSRADLVVAAAGSNRIAVFFQLVAGLYPLGPSLSIQHAQLQGPASLALGDLNGDGLVDIASSNTGSDNLTVFLATAPGAFGPSPAWVLGGPGITDDPVSIVIGDVNGDGRDDLATGNRGGNDISVFLQAPTGDFSATPSMQLQAAEGPIQPNRIVLTDIDGDGFGDIASANGADDLGVFLYRPTQGSFTSELLLIQGSGDLQAPEDLRALDLNSDGRTDLVAANTGASNIAIFLQQGSGGFDPATPDLNAGGATLTSGLRAVTCADLDGDGDLDLATANETDDTVSLFSQLAPGIFAQQPSQTLGAVPAMDGLQAIASGDLNGDGRVDLVCAARTAGTLSVFHQSLAGDFSTTPQLSLGAGGLASPVFVVVADLDQDGRSDLASVNQTGSNIAIFFQDQTGSFAVVPDLTLGSAATTPGPVHAVAADLDADGDIDLAVASRTGNTIAVFRQTSPSAFPLAPDSVLGGAGTTASINAVASADLNGDGRNDLAGAVQGNHRIAIFWQSAGGGFTASPNLVLNDAGMSGPISVALGDVDRDGDVDIVGGSLGTQNLSVFRQSRAGVFQGAPDHHGGPGRTDAPSGLTIIDLDGDGDPDLVSAHSPLERASVFFGSH